MEQATGLTFAALNERIDAMPEHPSMVVGLSRREKYGSTIALLAVALVFLSLKVLPDNQWYTLVIASSLILVEVIAVVAVLIPHWPLRLPSFRADRIEYAEQLDHDFKYYGSLISWIVQYPREQIAALADYAEMRQERFREKQPLLIGGVEKLGIVPVLAAIAIQFKGMHWPPEVSWIEVVASLFTAWLYWICLMSINTRHRGRFIEVALKRALAIKDNDAAIAVPPAQTCAA